MLVLTPLTSATDLRAYNCTAIMLILKRRSGVVAGAISGRFSARALLGYLFVPKFTGLLSESGFWRLLLGLYSSCMAII